MNNTEIFKAMRFTIQGNKAVYATGSVANYTMLKVRLDPVHQDGEEFFFCEQEELHECGDYRFDYESRKTFYRTIDQIAKLVNSGLRKG